MAAERYQDQGTLRIHGAPLPRVPSSKFCIMGAPAAGLPAGRTLNYKKDVLCGT